MRAFCFLFARPSVSSLDVPTANARTPEASADAELRSSFCCSVMPRARISAKGIVCCCQTVTSVCHRSLDG